MNDNRTSGRIPGLITSQELANAKINTHWFAAGYDIDEVDDYFDRAADTIAYYEHGGDTPTMPAPTGPRYFDVDGGGTGDTIWLKLRPLDEDENHKPSWCGHRLTVADALAVRDVLDRFLRSHGVKEEK